MNCIGAGTISVESGSYCGGVVGQGKGTVKECCSRSLLSAENYVGGIVGDGENVSDCKAYSFIVNGNEYVGTIAGNISGTVENSLFVQNGVGAVDGISYKGTAEPVAYNVMLKQDGIPDVFKKIVVTFIADNAVVDEEEVSFGGSIDKLPQVPMNGVQYWKWDDFDSEHIYYSMTVTGQYYNPRTTIATNEDIPLFLVKGNFYEGQKLKADEFSPKKYDDEISADDVSMAYTLSVNDYTGKFKVRMKNSDKGTLYVVGSDGKYKQTDYETDGSYIVFTAENGSSVVFAQDKTYNSEFLVLATVSGVDVLAAAAFVTVTKQRKRNPQKSVRHKKISTKAENNA